MYKNVFRFKNIVVKQYINFEIIHYIKITSETRRS